MISLQNGLSLILFEKNSQNTAEPVQLNGLAPIMGPLQVNPANPRYFTDGSGRAIYLTGSHYWLNLQDGGLTDPSPTFNYKNWLDFLQSNNHNFFRLWTWEQAKWVLEWSEPYYFSPMPYQRTGPGNGLDGKPKFDLTKFNQTYFDRIRQRVSEAGQRGIYVSIMLFDGWSVEYPKEQYHAANPWLGHPFNVNNNINGINGDPNGDNSGEETHQLAVPEVTALQEAYVKKVIDSVNDLDNVLYEISNESPGNSQEWQYHLLRFIKSYEASKGKQHPVGMTVEWPNGSNSDLFNSPADWISPSGELDNPPAADGSKVIVADTDHLCGICGNQQWVWESFTRGQNPLFMDQYDDSYKLEGGGYDPNNANDVSLRRNLGYTLSYASRMKLVAMTPRADLCSTGYCLANPAASGAEYLVYLPAGNTLTGFFKYVGIDRTSSVYLPFDSFVTVDLTATSGDLMVEWFNPGTGETVGGSAVSGGEPRSFYAPFRGAAVLYLYQGSAK
ncbi:MAG: hypothetical protein DPW09_22765 [Anaerolineae bacterium]|nr:hypothetical protein [Anaerolineae bacterium]